MRYTVTGDIADLFYFGLYDPDTNQQSYDDISASSTQIVVQSNVTDAIVTVTGFDFELGSQGATDGTITNILFELNGETFGTVTDIAWDLPTFGDALRGIELFDFAPLAGLINQSNEVIVDYSGATGYLNLEGAFEEVAPLITVGATYIDGDFDADLVGTNGDDTFNITGPEDDFNFIAIEATEGDDTVDASDMEDGVFVLLDYDQDYSPVRNPITVDIDEGANTATITAPDFVDTIIDVATFMGGDGVTIVGSQEADTFNVSLTSGNLELEGGGAPDIYNITMNDGATLRLTFAFGSNNDPNQGLVIDLGTATISNDGFGNMESFNLTYNGGRLDVQGTEFGDMITGSTSNNRLIPLGGDDTLDGGEGFDQARYDRRDVGAMNIDLDAGTASGTFRGDAFTDTLISIEAVRGSREEDDTIKGSNNDDRLEGRGGDDDISGRLGDDEIGGGEGNDTLRGNAGEDEIYGDDGDDIIRGQKNGDDLFGDAGNDNIKGGGGNDYLNGGDGNDFLNGGARADNIEGEVGDDILIGRSFGDTLYGGDGDDVLNAGGDNDRVEGGSGNDFIKAGDGNDVFIFDVGFDLDRLVDFDVTEDRLEFRGNVEGSLDEAGIAALAAQNGANVDIDLGSGNIVRFLNTDLDALTGLENVIDFA